MSYAENHFMKLFKTNDENIKASKFVCKYSDLFGVFLIEDDKFCLKEIRHVRASDLRDNLQRLRVNLDRGCLSKV